MTPVWLEGGVTESTNLTFDLKRKYGIFFYCNLSNPKGKIMLRLIPTAVHTKDDVNETIEAFTKVKTSYLVENIYQKK